MELDEVRKEVADLRIRVAELGTEAHEKRLEGQETNKIIAEMEAEIKAMRNRCLMIFADSEGLKEEARQKVQEALFKEEDIKAEELRLNIENFMSEQKDFIEVLEQRTAIAQRNANHSLVGMDSGITPKEFIEEIRKDLARVNSFGNVVVFTRGAITQYKQALNTIANVHVSGKRVPLELKMRPLNIIDGFLSDGLIEPRWNK